uniref:Dynein regulatory complex subunit 4 n=1 Tax=Schistocephalus solidus TaxID=70667 RepID=A0A0X3PUD7_SCHSO
MPPKKKSIRGKALKKTPTVIDGVSTSDMTKEQLEEHVMRLREEMEREREERNYFQLERDKINTFWEVTKKQLEARNAELRLKSREIEEAEERHLLELKVYKQKVKHLLFEHQNGLTEGKQEMVSALRLAEESFGEDRSMLVQDKRLLKVSLKEAQLAKEDMMRKMKLTHEEQFHKLREDFERQLEENRRQNQEKLKKLQESMELQRKTELHETEERKNNQINTLIQNHEKSFSDIKNYYNDITLNNLALINNLKEKIEEMRIKEERLERHNTELTTQNKNLLEPITRIKQENDELKRALENHERDVRALKITKDQLKKTKENFKDLQFEFEVVSQRLQFVEKERDELYEKFVSAVQEVQQKCGLKNTLLERRLAFLGEKLEKKELQFNEVMSTGNVDPVAVAETTRKLEETMDSKNMAIKDLQYELARVCKAHNDLLEAIRVKMANFGVPFDELGFRTVDCVLPNHILGKGPAGLVSIPP